MTGTASEVSRSIVPWRMRQCGATVVAFWPMWCIGFISRTVRSSARPAPSTRLCCAENAVKWRLSTVLLPKSWFSPLSSARPSKAGGSFSRTAARA